MKFKQISTRSLPNGMNAVVVELQDATEAAALKAKYPKSKLPANQFFIRTSNAVVTEVGLDSNGYIVDVNNDITIAATAGLLFQAQRNQFSALKTMVQDTNTATLLAAKKLGLSAQDLYWSSLTSSRAAVVEAGVPEAPVEEGME